MESILVNLISDVFSIAGQFYDDLQSVPLTIDELKQAFEKAGIIVSEKSIEEITLHLENLSATTRLNKAEHARIIQEYEEERAAMYEAAMYKEEIPTEEEALREADEFEKELMEKGEIF